MTSADGSLGFWEKLPAFERFQEVCDLRRYAPVPADWSVVVTDVRGSTRHVAEGRYKDVNVLGAASIAVALNVCAPRPPFVFGGDGATILVPDAQIAPLAAALSALVRVARQAFGMDLRVGAVSVAELRRQGFDVAAAKYAVSPDVTLAMLSGDGIDEATRRIKQEEARYTLLSPERPALPEAPVAGLECRWKPLASRHGEIVTLIVKATAADPTAQTVTYRGILDFLGTTFDEATMCPVTLENVSLVTDAAGLEAEARVRTGRAHGWRHFWYRFWARQQNRIGARLIRRGSRLGTFDGAAYPRALVANSDFRKFDGMLRMVIDATPEQRRRLETFLEERFRAGDLTYGLATSPVALMTCLVFDYVKDHVHFVDGGDGGYTAAARQMAERGMAAVTPPRRSSAS